MKRVSLEEAEIVRVERPDGTVLYIGDDYTGNGFQIASDSPFRIRPRSDNSILLEIDITAQVRRNKAKAVK